MIELLALVFVIVIVVMAVRLGRQNDTPSAPMDRLAGCLSEGLGFARQHAEQKGDTEAVQAIDNGTYNELLEHRAAKRETITADDEIYSYSIAGINYRKCIAAYVGNSVGYIKPEPTNIYDPNAIAVYADDGHHLGYIPATDTYEVHALHLRFPAQAAIDIEECCDADDRRFFVGEVTIKVQTKKNTKI